MKNFVGLMCMLAALLVCTSEGVAQEVRKSVTDLAWLSGCWEVNVPDKNLLITEQWMKPAGGMMIGAGRTIKNGKAVDYEFLRIVEEADSVFYVAKPTANKDETRFRLVRSAPGEVVFENPSHDFPQRIIYKLSGDKLNARIESTSNGRSRGVDFPYSRVKCE